MFAVRMWRDVAVLELGALLGNFFLGRDLLARKRGVGPASVELLKALPLTPPHRSMHQSIRSLRLSLSQHNRH